jgi:nicotinate-nucleotide pyrophosphorylase (carboxylating)
MVLVKDNHIAGTELRDLAGVLSGAVRKSRAEDMDRPIEVEVDGLEQLREVLKVEGVDLILLDNMDCPAMKTAVEMRDRAGKKGVVELEASGGVSLQTVHSIALTGVERIAVGAITHSAEVLDIGLDIET